MNVSIINNVIIELALSLNLINNLYIYIYIYIYNTYKINASGIAYMKLIKLAINPRIAIVEFSLTGKLISHASSKVSARTLDEPQTSA
jgi:hypothetical protein